METVEVYCTLQGRSLSQELFLNREVADNEVDSDNDR